MQNILNFDVKDQDAQFKSFHKVRGLRHSDYISIYPSIYVLFIFLYISRLVTENMQSSACSQ